MTKSYPTNWQKMVLWSALTALAMAIIGALTVFLLIALKRVLGFLQPILTPIAVAGIIAYLMNPLVDKLVARKVPRTRAVTLVFAPMLLAFILIGSLIIPRIYDQSVRFAKAFPALETKASVSLENAVKQYRVKYEQNAYIKEAVEQSADWAQKQLPELPLKLWRFVTGSVQGFLGVFGVLLGMLLVPVYVFFFLTNAERISQRWSVYLPLRASPFKDELVSCLSEINSYLMAFFRGQILVTTIDGVLLTVALLFMGLEFAILIGLAVAVLQLVPYLGVLVCWIPAVLIATVQFHNWQGPLWVTVIFFVVTHLDSLFIAPRIVGESVGLHPMTIIVSVFVWSLVFGGLLGALLAVPLTATLKVLLRRYVWERRFKAQTVTVTRAVPHTISEPPSESAKP